MIGMAFCCPKTRYKKHTAYCRKLTSLYCMYALCIIGSRFLLSVEYASFITQNIPSGRVASPCTSHTCLKTNAGISIYPLDVTPPRIVFNLRILQYFKKLPCDLLHISTQCARSQEPKFCQFAHKSHEQFLRYSCFFLFLRHFCQIFHPLLGQ